MWAVIVGGVGFLGGFVGPLLLSDSNTLGPLWGILVTGPIGALAGGVWGAVRWAASNAKAAVGQALQWVVVIWLIALAYTLLSFSRFGPHTALWALGLQLFLLAATAKLLWGKRTSPPLRSWPRRFRSIVVAGIFLGAVMTAFPPVTSPSWNTSAEVPGSTSLPHLAFLLDSRLSETLTVSIRTLLLEWVAVIIVAGAAGFAMAKIRTIGDEG